MSTIKNVAVVGAGGNLGPSILSALLSAIFTVTVLTRADSKSTFPDGVRVHKTDYDSASSLAEALRGQDAVVSTIATAALGTQTKIIDAAVKAGVRRFIPSEFGIKTTDLHGGVAKILAGKTETLELLKKTAEGNERFSWTGVSTSLFFDWGLRVGSLGFSTPKKTGTIYDSGNESFTGTNLDTIGAAIAAILRHPEETANRYLEIASFSTTQNEILAALQGETGDKFTITTASTDESQKIADEKLARGDFSAFGDYLKVYLFKDREGRSPKVTANAELGLEKEDLRETIRKFLKK